MPAANAVPPADDPDDFAPATPRPRRDGWTIARQRGFIEALTVCGSVEQACAQVGMSPASAYRLRAHPLAEDFHRAWNLALDASHARLIDIAIQRVREGTPVPILSKGEVVAERRVYSDTLLMYLIRRHDQSAVARDPLGVDHTRRSIGDMLGATMDLFDGDDDDDEDADCGKRK